MQAGEHVVRGTICTLVGGALWGFSGSCSQYLMSHYALSALTLTAVRMLGAGILFLIVLLVRNRAQLAQMLHDRPTCKGVAIFGLFGLALDQLTYLLCVQNSNAGTATVLQSLGIIFVMAWMCFTWHRRPQRRELIGVVLAVGSTWLIATQGDPLRLAMSPAGLFWGVSTALVMSFYSLFPRRLFARWGAFAITGTGMLTGGVVSAVAVLPSMPLPELDATGWLVLAAIIVAGTFAAFGLYLQGVADAGAMRASMLGVIEPASAQFVSWLWLGTAFSAADWIGFALMSAMIVIVSLPQNRLKGTGR